MNYPENIYNKYEIIEKDIYGEKHYCLVRIYSIFGISFRRKVKVGGLFGSRINGPWSSTWHPNKRSLEEAIKNDIRQDKSSSIPIHTTGLIVEPISGIHQIMVK